MIKNIVFDFGDVFINLDKNAPFREMATFGFTEVTPALDQLAKDYEMGLLETDAFLDQMQTIFPKATRNQIITAWNAIILDFPEHRLKFIENLKKENTHRLFLLSNTNNLHIKKVIEHMGAKRFERFKNCFEGFYLSQEMKMRKPTNHIYRKVLQENNLVPSETLFIDDTKENIEGAANVGIKCWHLQVGKEDIMQLKQHT